MSANSIAIAASAAALMQISTALAQDLSSGRWIDLTHPFNAESVYWPTAEMFEKQTVAEGPTEGGYYYSAYNFSAAEHGGTHLDAPIHFAEGANTADVIPVEQMIGPGFVIDVTAQAAEDVDYRVSAADIEAFEQEHGQIPEGGIVLLNTGRAALYLDREAYMGTAERGAEAVAKLHFPGLGVDAAELLVERGIGAVGIDTPSIDHGQSTNFETHVALMTNNVPAFENVDDMSELPPTGSHDRGIANEDRRRLGRPPAHRRLAARVAGLAVESQYLSAVRVAAVRIADDRVLAGDVREAAEVRRRWRSGRGRSPAACRSRRGRRSRRRRDRPDRRLEQRQPPVAGDDVVARDLGDAAGVRRRWSRSAARG